MSFRRKCTICCFVGIDDDFFTKNKKICDSCINNKKQDRENKKNESKSKKIEYQKNGEIIIKNIKKITLLTG